MKVPYSTDEELNGWISLEAATRNVVVLLRLRTDSPDAQANITEGSLSPEGRESFDASGETELVRSLLLPSVLREPVSSVGGKHAASSELSAAPADALPETSTGAAVPQGDSSAKGMVMTSPERDDDCPNVLLRDQRRG